MTAFNAIGGVIYGTIILSIIWFIVIHAFGGDANEDPKEKGGLAIIGVVIAFIMMLFVLANKCSSS